MAGRRGERVSNSKNLTLEILLAITNYFNKAVPSSQVMALSQTCLQLRHHLKLKAVIK